MQTIHASSNSSPNLLHTTKTLPAFPLVSHTYGYPSISPYDTANSSRAWLPTHKSPGQFSGSALIGLSSSIILQQLAAHPSTYPWCNCSNTSLHIISPNQQPLLLSAHGGSSKTAHSSCISPILGGLLSTDSKQPLQLSIAPPKLPHGFY
ncbi:hypothetical protein L7F22_024412 [Adiantum nelumboides]|nr:hypothetical protein [Adiantum nelumboides]